MVRWDLVRERLRASRRSFSETWSLFKESRIGVAGAVIMVVFVVLALLAPYLGLKDPIHWRAPSEDVIELQEFWATDTSTFLFDAGDPINSQIAFRIIPRRTDTQADRVYAASGSKLLAIDPTTGTRGWRTPFQAASEISAGPIVINHGAKGDPKLPAHIVYIGTTDGTFYALNDTTQSGETGSPGGSAVVFRTLAGPITSIAAWSDEFSGLVPEERVFVGTSNGHLYGFSADGLAPLWEISDFGTDAIVRMASGPLSPPPVPSYSPALTDAGDFLVVNADGWYGLRTADGFKEWGPFPVGTPWTSAPVVAIPSDVPGAGYIELAYAASDDGWLFARRAKTGALYPAWQTSPAALPHPLLQPGETAIPVMQTAQNRDPGRIHAPLIDSKTIYVTSESGYLYSLTRDAVGNLPAGGVRWRFTDSFLLPRGFRFVDTATIPLTPRLVYVVGLDGNGTADPADDDGLLYSIREDGTMAWRRRFEGFVASAPVVWSSAQIVPSLWLGTAHGFVYSISSTGRYLAPLPPGTYPSGITYLWGTDNQGRDILSQFIWGSRIALIVGFASALLAVGIGTLVGLVAGYVGRKTETVLMRFTDVVLVLPALPLLIVLSAVLGASITNIILVIAILAWPGTARVIRSEVLSLKERPYIHSARVTGASSLRIMLRHLLPNVMPLVFLYMTFAVSGAILTEAALSFLGLGDINTPSWGTMLSTVQQSDLIRAYWWLLPPGLGITLLALAFYLVGRAFETVLNPRLRTR